MIRSPLDWPWMPVLQSSNTGECTVPSVLPVHCSPVHCTVLCCTALYYVALCTAVHITIVYCIVQYCTALYGTVPSSTVPYSTALPTVWLLRVGVAVWLHLLGIRMLVCKEEPPYMGASSHCLCLLSRAQVKTLWFWKRLVYHVKIFC